MYTEPQGRIGLNNSLCVNKRTGVNNLLFPVKLGSFDAFVRTRRRPPTPNSSECPRV